MIQWRPHGITNSTDFSVLVMKPHSLRIRSRGTTRWMPLLASTSSAPAAAEHLLDLVGPHAAGVDHDLGAHLDLAVVLEVHQPRPDDAVALAQEADHLGARGHVGAVRRGGARDVHHQPGVVDLAVVVADRARELVGAQVGRQPRELPAEQVLVLRARPSRTCGRPSPCRRTASARRRRTAAPRCGATGRGTAPAGPGAARAGSAAGRAPRAPP